MKKIRLHIALVALFFVAPNVVNAQDELDDMSLEELMAIQIKRTTIIDVPHMHNKGDFMVLYKFMTVKMPGLKNNSSILTTNDILTNYPVSPANMTMSMHMIGAMWAPSDNVNIMAMLPYQQKDMALQMQSGNTFSTASSGIGDLQLTGLFMVKKNGSSQIFGTLGLSMPFGSINARDDTPMSVNNETRLAYPMQLGSGTLDPIIGMTALKITDRYGLGVNVNGVLRLYDNANDYRKGNELKAISWFSYILKDFIILTSKIDYLFRSPFSGADLELNPMLTPVADPTLQSGSQLLVGLGINVLPLKGNYDQFRITLEGSLPIYQNFDGPQMYKSSEISISISNVF